MKKRDGCQCEACKECCSREPGWFVPGEIPVAAKFLEISEKEFLTRYTAKHPVEGGIALAPKQKASGACIFFVKGLCSIHNVKPFECRAVFGCDSPRRHTRIRARIAKEWSA